MTTLGKLAAAGALAILVLAGAGTYYLTKDATPAPVACTAEAKLCPDGSAVGRTSPNCEFAACPALATSSIEIRVASSSEATSTSQ